MDPVQSQGRSVTSGTSVRVGPAPGTTQQLNVDNSECTTMRAPVGASTTSGVSYPIYN